MLLPLQGAWTHPSRPQGDALGYVLLPLRGVWVFSLFPQIEALGYALVPLRGAWKHASRRQWGSFTYYIYKWFPHPEGLIGAETGCDCLESGVDDAVIDQLRHGDMELGCALHLALDGVHRSLVACP